MSTSRTASDASTSIQDLTEVTFQRLYGAFAQPDTMDREPLEAALEHRARALKHCYNASPKPSTASRKQVESGKVALRDGTALEIPVEDQEIVWEVSAALGLDEVEALTLFRLFLFNEEISKDQASNPSLLLDALLDFYHEERLFAIRLVASLLRSKEVETDAYQSIASEFVARHIPDVSRFALDALTALTRRASDLLPPAFCSTARSTARWAKQNLKEQLALLESIFWATVATNADGQLVLAFLNTAGTSNLGYKQAHSEVLLDEECAQLFHDIGTLFGITAAQLLKLDKLLDEPLDLELATKLRYGYLASPKDVDTIQQVISSFPDDPRYSPLILAWGFVMAQIAALPWSEVPEAYQDFHKTLVPESSQKGRVTILEPVLNTADSLISRAVVLDVLPTLVSYTRSPVLSTSLAAATGSYIAEPNNEQFRYVVKCLLMALIDSVKIEYIPGYDLLVNVWSNVFGTGEMPIVVGLCTEFWTRDIADKVARRGLLDTAASRYPVEISPLIHLLRAMTGTGGLEELDSVVDDGQWAAMREISSRNAFLYFRHLGSYTQVLSPKHLAGPLPLYETRPDSVLGYYYTNTRPIILPGGSELPAGSRGRVLTTQGATVVSWAHRHSGWQLLLDVLRNHHHRRTTRSRTGPFNASRNAISLDLEDIGLQVDDEDALVADILDLFRSLLFKNLGLAAHILEHLGDTTTTSGHIADLIQITLLILRDALVASQNHAKPAATRIVASALGVLTALLPSEPGKIWPFLKNLPQLFGDERQTGTTPLLLHAERSSGSYHVTLALLDLVGGLFDEAFRMVLTHPGALQQMKTDVLLRALNFVHAEIWVEHVSWKYIRASDRFEIGRKVANIYGEVLKLSPPLQEHQTPAETTGQTLAPLTGFVLDTFLFKATGSTVNPLVTSIATVRNLFETFRKTLRFVDVHNLTQLLESNLRLTRLVLVRKYAARTTKLSLLEQTFLSGLATSATSFRGRPSVRLEPIDVIAGLVRERAFGAATAMEAIQLLSAFCASISTSQPVCPSIVGHLTDPEDTASGCVALLRNPYEDIPFRQAVWDFICIVVDTQPAFATLFVSGKLFASKDISLDEKVDGVKKGGNNDEDADFPTTALAIACDMVASPTFWDVSYMLQSSALSMLDLVWQHAFQHLDALSATRKDTGFWRNIAAIASKDLGPYPASSINNADGYSEKQTQLVAEYAYHAKSKAHALHILALDMKIDAPQNETARSIPLSAAAVIDLFKAQDRLATHIGEAMQSAYAPALHDQLQDIISIYFPSFTLDSVRFSTLPSQRVFGDEYLYQSKVVHNRLMKAGGGMQNLEEQATVIFEKTCGVNLNWSLTDAQIALMRSWTRLFQDAAPYVHMEKGLGSGLLKAARNAAQAIGEETRGGSIMVSIHSERLSLLLSLLEAIWLAPASETADGATVTSLLKSTRIIALNDVFPPLESLRQRHAGRFHMTLLQIIYFCAKKAGSLTSADASKLDYKLSISADIGELLGLVVGGIRVALELAYASGDSDLDPDLRLLIAVFDQCTRPSLHVSPSNWLARCQEYDLLRVTLEALIRSQFAESGTSGARTSVYAQHLLYLHIILARQKASAERLANESIVTAYTKTDLTPYLETGALDPLFRAPTGEYGLSHRAWRTMLGVATSLVHTIGSGGHFISSDIVSFIQLFGAQLSHSLAWTANQTITVGLLEDILRVVELFQAIASCSVSSPSGPDRSVQEILLAFTERVLHLTQQINYALSHPNHLATLLEAVTAEERAQLEREGSLGTIEQISDLLKPDTRPFLTSIVQMLLMTVRDIVSALSIVGKADDIFCAREAVPWAQYPPHLSTETKVLSTGPATLGTLRDLATFALDVLRFVSKPENALLKADPDSVPGTLIPFNAQQTRELAVQTLEQTMMYAVTQLSSTIHQPVAPVPAKELGDSTVMDIDVSQRKSIFPSRAGPGVGEQLRAMRQWKEMAIELNILAKDVPPKAGWATKEFFDEVATSTYTLVDQLERRLREGR